MCHWWPVGRSHFIRYVPAFFNGLQFDALFILHICCSFKFTCPLIFSYSLIRVPCKLLRERERENTKRTLAMLCGQPTFYQKIKLIHIMWRNIFRFFKFYLIPMPLIGRMPVLSCVWTWLEEVVHYISMFQNPPGTIRLVQTSLRLVYT